MNCLLNETKKNQIPINSEWTIVPMMLHVSFKFVQKMKKRKKNGINNQVRGQLKDLILWISNDYMQCEKYTKYISLNDIQHLIYLLCFFEISINDIWGVFNNFFGESNKNKKPNVKIFHSMIQFQDTISDASNIIDVMVNQWNIKPTVATFTILLSKFQDYFVNDIDKLDSLNMEMNKYNIKPNSHTFAAWLLICQKIGQNNKRGKTTDKHRLNQYKYKIMDEMINNVSNPDMSWLIPFRIGIDLCLGCYDMEYFNKLLEWFYHKNSNINFDDIDQETTILLIEAFGLFEQYDQLSKFKQYCIKRWKSFENIPPKISKELMKSLDQINMFSIQDNDDNDNNNHIGSTADIENIKKTLDWVISMDLSQELQICSNAMLSQLSLKSDTNVESLHGLLIWSPFSYLFDSMLNNNEKFDEFDTLNWIYRNVPCENSCLLPATMCVLTTSIDNKKFIGFSMATVPALKHYQYQKTMSQLPSILKHELYLFRTHSGHTNSEFQKLLLNHIDTVSTYRIDWKQSFNTNCQQLIVSPRGMCQTCCNIFYSLNTKCNTFDKTDSARNYVLKCAEWEAITRFVNSIKVV